MICFVVTQDSGDWRTRENSTFACLHFFARQSLGHWYSFGWWSLARGTAFRQMMPFYDEQMQHKWICSVVDLEIFVRGPELFIFDSNRWLVYHDESSFVFPPCKKPSSAIKDSAFIQFRWTCWTLHVPKSIHPFHESGLGWRVVETVNPSAFARPPTCFKAYLAWMFSLPKFPDPSTWPWWLSIWLWWLEDGIFSELKGYMGNKENEGKMNVAVDYSSFVSSN